MKASINKRKLFFAISSLAVVSLAYSWCFFVPPQHTIDELRVNDPDLTEEDYNSQEGSITYNRNPNPEDRSWELNAWNGGWANMARSQPIIQDFQGGRMILANIITNHSFDVVFTLSDGTSKTVTVTNRHGIALSPDASAYYLISVEPRPNLFQCSIPEGPEGENLVIHSNNTGCTIVDTTKDIRVRGNWVAETESSVIYREGPLPNSNPGGHDSLFSFIRVNVDNRQSGLLGEPLRDGRPSGVYATSAQIRSLWKYTQIWHNGENRPMTVDEKFKHAQYYENPWELPYDASETAFSTRAFAEKVTCVERGTCTCEELGNCPELFPVKVAWSLKRVFVLE